MNNKSMIAALLMLAAASIFVLAISSRNIVLENKKDGAPLAEKTGGNPVDMAAVEGNYKTMTIEAVKQYEQLSNDLSSEAGEKGRKLSSIKNSLISLKVPPKYKDLHLKLVLLFSSSDKLVSGEGLASIKDIKTSHEWLNYAL